MKKKHTKTMKMTLVATMLLHSRKDPYSICWSSSNNNLGIVKTNSFQKVQKEERQGGIMKCQTRSCIIARWHSRNPSAMHNNLVFCVVHLNKRLSKLPSTSRWNPANQLKTKAPKKGGIQGTKWKDPHPRRQKNHLRGQTTRRTSSSQTSSNHKKHIK
jgi:hypothetical protein